MGQTRACGFEEIRRLVAPKGGLGPPAVRRSLRPRGMAGIFAIDAFSRSPGSSALLSFTGPILEDR